MFWIGTSADITCLRDYVSLQPRLVCNNLSTSPLGACGRWVTMEMPAELRFMIAERVSSVEDRAALCRVSRVWGDCVDRTIKTWVQQLPAGKQFAASLDAGLRTLQQHMDGRGFFVHTLFRLCI